MSVDLTVAERLILVNQYEILKRLDPDSAAGYELKIEILRDGYAPFYFELDRGLVDDEPELTMEEFRFVADVLEMFYMVHVYRRDHSEDAELAKHGMRHFPGFSGNQEHRLMALAKFAVHRLDRWSEQLEYTSENDDMNSHYEMAERYKLMLAEWKRQGKPDVDVPRAVVLAVLNAGTLRPPS
jgi:uncharacterized protein YfbU (UPF0304 family)